MKKKIIGLIIVVLNTAILANGCNSISYADNLRFIRISDEFNGGIYYDKETKVEYWISDGGYNRGTLTMLVDENGKPLLYDN